jgi:hypothetical protein
MASDRQKRKRRQASREGSASGAPAGSGGDRAGGAPPGSDAAGGEGPSGGFYARARAKDEAARAKLEPLAEGERPRAVTVAAAIALLLGLANLVAFAAGLEIQGERPKTLPTVFYSLLMLAAAWGLWQAKYWAVLGMEVLLGFLILIFAVLLVTATNVGAVLISVAILAGAGTLFWSLIKAMARIQMPERR